MFILQFCPDISPGTVQPDNETIRGVGHKTVLLPLGIFGLNKFTFLHCLMPTASVIIKRYLCGENVLKVIIHHVLGVVFMKFIKYFLKVVQRVINSMR